jgi:hypothetical protein
MALWSDGLEEQLIGMVKERPALYAVADKNYYNKIISANFSRI